VPEYITDEIDPPDLDRENLPIALDRQLELRPDIEGDKLEEDVEESLVVVEDYKVVGVPEIVLEIPDRLDPIGPIPETLLLADRPVPGPEIDIPGEIGLQGRRIVLEAETSLEVVVEIAKVNVGEVLGEIVSDRQARSRVDYLVDKPKEIRILEFFPDQGLEDGVVDTRVILFDISLEGDGRPLGIECKGLTYGLGGPVYAPFFHASVRPGREDPNPKRLEYVHYCVVDDPVPEREPGDLSLLGLVDLESMIRRGLIRLIPQLRLQSRKISLKIGLESLYLVPISFALTGFLFGEAEVIEVVNLGI
jgi:hypothetical protein